MNCRFYVHYALSVMQQQKQEVSIKLPSRRASINLKELQCLKARCVRAHDGASVCALEGQESFQTMPLLEMNGWVVMDESEGSAQSGEMVNFIPCTPADYPIYFDEYNGL